MSGIAAPSGFDEKYAVIVKLLSDYFSPQKNTSISILIFRQASQRQGEGIDAFVVRLKSLTAQELLLLSRAHCL